jgi:hypothetical protein
MMDATPFLRSHVVKLRQILRNDADQSIYYAQIKWELKIQYILYSYYLLSCERLNIFLRGTKLIRYERCKQKKNMICQVHN